MKCSTKERGPPTANPYKMLNSQDLDPNPNPNPATPGNTNNPLHKLYLYVELVTSFRVRSLAVAQKLSQLPPRGAPIPMATQFSIDQTESPRRGVGGVGAAGQGNVAAGGGGLKQTGMP